MTHTRTATAAASATPLLELRHVSRTYRLKRPLPIGPHRIVSALDDVSLRLGDGETLGVIGESGCGKSTLGRIVSGLEAPSAGQVLFSGEDVTRLGKAERKEMRRNIQLIFQDPSASLDPRKTVGRIVGEPFEIHRGLVSPERRRAKVGELLELVGLNPDHADRLPHQFSGGQQQRIGIARGIALEPRLLVCDEAVSALDVSVRAQIVNLLADLQREFGMSYLFIAHDLQIVEHMSDRVLTMYLGRVAETGPTREVYENTSHPYTGALLSAAPELRTGRGIERKQIVLSGDPPSPIDPPSGCRFRTRCWMATEICATTVPQPVTIAGRGSGSGSQDDAGSGLPDCVDSGESAGPGTASAGDASGTPSAGTAGPQPAGAHMAACHFAAEVPAALSLTTTAHPTQAHPTTTPEETR
ncbi:ABC transporter ATP-binding protein [Brevibacterium casei]